MRRSMEWKRLGVMSGLLIASLGLTGCGDDGDESPPSTSDGCAGVTNCVTVGERMCNDDSSSVLICRENEADCAVWATERSCGSNAACADGACSCNDGCSMAGEYRCTGDVVETCSTDAVGCRYWATYTDCAASGETCEPTAGGAGCVGTCTSECQAAGDLRCSGELLQTCSASTDGCLRWVTSDDCAANVPAETCDDAGATPVCVSSCTDACPANGNTQCEGDAVQTCIEAANGCLAWETTTDCATNDPAQTCDASGGTAVCSDTCTDSCDTEDALQCSGDAIQTCTRGTNGCLAWVTTTDCAANTPAQICDASGGAPACVNGCTDGCPAANDTRCSSDVVQTCTTGGNGCLAWTNTTDCAASTPSQICDATGGTAVCAAACVDSCPAASDTRCSSDVVQTCTLGTDGCLAWVDTTDCAVNTPAQTCDASGGSAVCANTCSDACPANGDTQCAGDVVQTCSVGANGCLDWADTTDCAAQTPAQTCDASVPPATCVAPPAGESCAAPQVITLPFQVAGTNFPVDYSNDHNFSSGTGCSTANGAEAVFQLTMTAGQVIHIQEMTQFDAIIRVLSVCDDTNATCLMSQDTDEDFSFTAPSDGDYFIVLESYLAAPTNVAWDFMIQEVQPESNCTNAQDDDFDNDVDCADSDCFGVAGACETEALCGDGKDNDDDTLVDCADPDCASQQVCIVPKGLFERFTPTSQSDLEGCSLTFTPNAANASGYDLAGNCACEPAWVVEPGTGTATQTFTLTDDAASQYTFAQLPGFDFYGTTYTSLYVGSNGFVTFGAGDTNRSTSAATFFSHRRIAGVDDDLNPAKGGTITVDDFTDRVVVTFDGVQCFGSTNSNEVRFQIVMEANGTITIVYLRIDDKADGYAGIANGVTGTYPNEMNLLDAVAPPSTAGQLVITEIHYNDEAPTEGNGEFIEILNKTNRARNLGCCSLSDNTGTFDIPAGTTVDAGAYAVFVRTDVPADNGGITGGISYGSTIQLANSNPENVTITCGGAMMDTVPFDLLTQWPAGDDGASMQLSSLVLDDTTNDNVAVWCTSADAYGAGDLGTPGAANGDCSPATPLSIDFETDPTWTVAGDWEWGTPLATYAAGPSACAGGTGCYGTNMENTYSSSTDFATNYLLGPSLDLSAATVVSLTFDMWLVTELSWDFARVEFSVDGGTTWAPVPMSTPAYNGTDTHLAMWNGTVASTWMPATGDLTTAAGQADVQVRWALDTDNSGNRPGFYVDNVNVRAF